MRYHLLPITNYRHFKNDLEAHRAFFIPEVMSELLVPITEASVQSSLKKRISSLVGAAGEFYATAVKCAEKERKEYLKSKEGSPDLSKIRRAISNEPYVYFLYDRDSMSKLTEKLTPGDTIVLHGEGQPFVIGLDSSTPYDLDATKLARLLKEANLIDGVNIELLTCNSAVDYTVEDGLTLNFARDTSEALHFLCGYQNINVSGYSGLIVDKENGKFSVSKTIAGRNAGDKLSVDAARITYKNGVKDPSSPVELDLSHMAYGWARRYIETAKLGVEEINAEKLRLSQAPRLERSLSSHSFFSKPDSTTNTPTEVLGEAHAITKKP